MLKVYRDTSSEKQAIARLKGVEIAVANGLFTPLNDLVFATAKTLKFIVLNSTGYDFVDLVAAKKHNIRVANIPGFSTEAVAEHTIALMLAVSKKITSADLAFRRHPFEINPNSRKSAQFLGQNLNGKTLGIVGLGRIGAMVGKLAKGFGMNVIGTSRHQKKILGIPWVNLNKLLKTSDIVSIHLPLNEETKEVISRCELRLMKSSAILINTARGKHVNTKALYQALYRKEIAGAGIDVLDEVAKCEGILRLNNIVFSPHSSWWTKESLECQADMILENITAFIRGRPINIVN